METQFNVGDVVVLKSDGPKMTVNYVGKEIHCIWYDKEKSEFKTENFNPSVLKPYKNITPSLR